MFAWQFSRKLFSLVVQINWACLIDLIECWIQLLPRWMAIDTEDYLNITEVGNRPYKHTRLRFNDSMYHLPPIAINTISNTILKQVTLAKSFISEFFCHFHHHEMQQIVFVFRFLVLWLEKKKSQWNAWTLQRIKSITEVLETNIKLSYQIFVGKSVRIRKYLSRCILCR